MGTNLEALERLFNSGQPLQLRQRVLNREVLEQAARAAGYEITADAIGAAVPGMVAAEVMSGRVPGPISRLAISRLLGVGECQLWPVVEVSP